MMLEVRIGSFGLTFDLIPCRFHQGHTATCTFFANSGEDTRAQNIRQSFSIMQICWGGIDHGYGNSGPFFLLENTEPLPQDTTSRIRRLTWMTCYDGVLSG